MTNNRTEFGHPRVSCDCKQCTDPCRFIPGYLIPSDLKRLIPDQLKPEEALKWCEDHLLASPGAIVGNSVTGETKVIPTLVLASKSKQDPSCIFLDANRRCTIHDKAPFGCAFSKVCTLAPHDHWLSIQGLTTLAEEWAKPDSLYRIIWEHLNEIGKISPGAAKKQELMKAALAQEERTNRPPSPLRKRHRY